MMILCLPENSGIVCQPMLPSYSLHSTTPMLIRHDRPTKLQKRTTKAQYLRETTAHSTLQYTMKCTIRQHSINHLIRCWMSMMLLELSRSPQHLFKLKHSRSAHFTQKGIIMTVFYPHISLQWASEICNRSSTGQTEEHKGTMIHIPQQDLIERDGANYLLRGLQARSYGNNAAQHSWCETNDKFWGEVEYAPIE